MTKLKLIYLVDKLSINMRTQNSQPQCIIKNRNPFDFDNFIMSSQIQYFYLSATIYFLIIYMIELKMLELNLQPSSSVINYNYDSNSTINANQILKSTSQNNPLEVKLFLPCYLRIQIKRFGALVFEQCCGTMECMLLFDVNITNLPQNIVTTIKKNMAWTLCNQQEPLIEFNNKENPIEVYAQQQVGNDLLLRYRIRKTLSTRFFVSVLWTPFEVVRLIFSVQINPIEVPQSTELNGMIKDLEQGPPRKIKTQKSQPKSLKIMFNLMDYIYSLQRINHQGHLVGDMAQIYYTDDSNIGEYELAERIMAAEYTNQQQPSFVIQERLQKVSNIDESCFVRYFQKKKKLNKPDRQLPPQEQRKLINNDQQNSYTDSFSNAHFKIPLHRIPLVSIFSLMVPGYILGLISLAIYFQPAGADGLGDRLGAIATIFLAYIALIPVVRQNIQNSPKLTIIEIVGYMEILISVLCLIDSFVGTVASEIYEFVWQTNPFFLISLIIQGFASLILAGAIGTYYFHWLPKYSIKTGLRINFDPKQWQNKKCNEIFTKYAREKNIQIQYL